ncbi:MAG: hypothetical protein ACLQVY_06990 [Limisphaerales bacterium]
MRALTKEGFAPPTMRPFGSSFLSIQTDWSYVSSSKNWSVTNVGAISPNGYSSLSPYQEPEPNLSPRIVAKLNDLSLLKKGWDEGDALPIDAKALKSARNVLQSLGLVRPFQEPNIVPTFDGFLQLEWHKASRSLEFEYTPIGWSILGVNLVNAEHPYHPALSPLDAPAALEKFYLWFSTDELIWPST